MKKEDIMRLAADKARTTMRDNAGGPFGAAIVKDGEIIAVSSNSVLGSHDPTAHAEVNAIREACKKLGTHDLTGCEIYATGYPCPMCMGAIIWANIKKVYVSGLPEDAENIGFRDDYIYRFIKVHLEDVSVCEIKNLDRNIAKELYNEYAEHQKTIY